MTQEIPFKSKLTMATGGLRMYVPKAIKEAFHLKEGMIVEGKFKVVKK